MAVVPRATRGRHVGGVRSGPRGLSGKPHVHLRLLGRRVCSPARPSAAASSRWMPRPVGRAVARAAGVVSLDVASRSATSRSCPGRVPARCATAGAWRARSAVQLQRHRRVRLLERRRAPAVARLAQVLRRLPGRHRGTRKIARPRCGRWRRSVDRLPHRGRCGFSTRWRPSTARFGSRGRWWRRCSTCGFSQRVARPMAACRVDPFSSVSCAPIRLCRPHLLQGPRRRELRALAGANRLEGLAATQRSNATRIGAASSLECARVCEGDAWERTRRASPAKWRCSRRGRAPVTHGKTGPCTAHAAAAAPREECRRYRHCSGLQRRSTAAAVGGQRRGRAALAERAGAARPADARPLAHVVELEPQRPEQVEDSTLTGLEATRATGRGSSRPVAWPGRVAR